MELSTFRPSSRADECQPGGIKDAGENPAGGCWRAVARERKVVTLVQATARGPPASRSVRTVGHATAADSRSLSSNQTVTKLGELTLAGDVPYLRRDVALDVPTHSERGQDCADEQEDSGGPPIRRRVGYGGKVRPRR